MFTIRIADHRGLAFSETPRFRHVHGTYGKDNEVETIDRLELLNHEGLCYEVVRIGDCDVTVLNSNGKTIARWEQYAPSHPMYKAVHNAGPNAQTEPQTTGDPQFPSGVLTGAHVPGLHGHG